MDVAILYSGGKDSTYAIHHCMEKGWNIKYLLSVKPSRTDCYLFHFATVEYTKELSSMLGMDHIYTTCDVADPQQEAAIIKDIVQHHMVDALVLGGVGLQETQLRVLRDALFDLGVEVFAAHMKEEHTSLIEEMIEKGYDIRITQIAADGLSERWLGRKLDASTFQELKHLARKFGFHEGAEGGHYDTLVVDGPLFHKRLEIVDAVPVMETDCSGYLHVRKVSLIEKRPVVGHIY